MPQVSASELATHLDVSKGRVSQWVAEGKLRNTYTGDGKARRFDLDAVRIALGRTLDTAQALGNGRGTLKAIGALPESARDDESPADDDLKRRYDTARTMRLEEQARAARWDNGQRSGTLVLASEVESATLALIGQEIAQVESFIRRAARALGDQMGLDAKAAQAVMLTIWREYRGDRAAQAALFAGAAKPTAAEKAEDF
jgi:phage terminase Nu1 subunit (DNA packaging protein)